MLFRSRWPTEESLLGAEIAARRSTQRALFDVKNPMEVGGATSSQPARAGRNHRRLRLRTDSGGMAGTSVPAGNRWGDRSTPAARAVGVLQASARGARQASARRPVERSSKSYLGGEQSPWKMGRHCGWQQLHGVPTRQRSNASKAAVSRDWWRAVLATERHDSGPGTGRRVRGGPLRRIRAHPVDPVPRIPAALSGAQALSGFCAVRTNDGTSRGQRRW